MRKLGTHTERETNRQHSARKLQVIMFIHVYTATCKWRPVISLIFTMFSIFTL